MWVRYSLRLESEIVSNPTTIQKEHFFRLCLVHHTQSKYSLTLFIYSYNDHSVYVRLKEAWKLCFSGCFSSYWSVWGLQLYIFNCKFYRICSWFYFVEFKAHFIIRITLKLEIYKTCFQALIAITPQSQIIQHYVDCYLFVCYAMFFLPPNDVQWLRIFCFYFHRWWNASSEQTFF